MKEKRKRRLATPVEAALTKARRLNKEAASEEWINAHLREPIIVPSRRRLFHI